MSLRRCLLSTYRLLLLLYPYAFRQRFAPEMLELAEAAEADEWPLIFSDTSLAIVRCWLKPPATSSTLAPAAQDAYLALGESGLALRDSCWVLSFPAQSSSVSATPARSATCNSRNATPSPPKMCCDDGLWNRALGSDKQRMILPSHLSDQKPKGQKSLAGRVRLRGDG
jgi:hypothetical protein